MFEYFYWRIFTKEILQSLYFNIVFIQCVICPFFVIPAWKFRLDWHELMTWSENTQDKLRKRMRSERWSVSGSQRFTHSYCMFCQLSPHVTRRVMTSLRYPSHITAAISAHKGHATEDEPQLWELVITVWTYRWHADICLLLNATNEDQTMEICWAVHLFSLLSISTKSWALIPWC